MATGLLRREAGLLPPDPRVRQGDPLSIRQRLVPAAPGPSLREILGERGAAPLVILTALNFVDELVKSVVAVFAPNIRRAFHISNTQLGGLVGVSVLFLVLAAIPIGYVATRVDRARLLRVSAVTWGGFSVLNAFARARTVFGLAQLGGGISEGTVEPVGKAMLADLYPPSTWNRVFAVHTAANPAGQIVGPLLAGLVGVVVGGESAWRWAYIVCAVPTFVAVAASIRLRDSATRPVTSATVLRPAIGLGPAIRRITRIPTFRRMTVAVSVLGFAAVGFAPFASQLLEKDFGVGEGGRGLVFGILATASLLGTLIGGTAGERVFTASPSRATRMVGAAVAAYTTVAVVAVWLPSVVAFVAVMWLAIVAVSIAAAPAAAVFAAISPPRLRPLMMALLGFCGALFGGVIGGVTVGRLVDAFGYRWGLSSVLPAGVIGGLLMVRAGATVEDDIAALAADAATPTTWSPATSSDDAAETAAGGPSRRTGEMAMTVRSLDVSFGAVPILHGIDLDVPAGSIVALLGTNGAGKSTVLRAMAGLLPPGRGTVRLFGEDVTSLPAEARVRRGLAMVQGGRATFPSLTVLECLRLGAWTYRRDHARVAAAVDEAMDRFPILRDRAGQLAGTLSGGEQQQLVLARALVSSPRVLLVDELTLGLAPAAAASVLASLRGLAAIGITIVVVEQSAERAAEVAQLATFLERGRVRFTGTMAELLARDDLLRPVLLADAEASLAGGPVP